MHPLRPVSRGNCATGLMLGHHHGHAPAGTTIVTTSTTGSDPSAPPAVVAAPKSWLTESCMMIFMMAWNVLMLAAVVLSVVILCRDLFGHAWLRGSGYVWYYFGLMVWVLFRMLYWMFAQDELRLLDNVASKQTEGVQGGPAIVNVTKMHFDQFMRLTWSVLLFDFAGVVLMLSMFWACQKNLGSDVQTSYQNRTDPATSASNTSVGLTNAFVVETGVKFMGIQFAIVHVVLFMQHWACFHLRTLGLKTRRGH